MIGATLRTRFRALGGGRCWGWIRVLHASLPVHSIVLGLLAGCSRGQAGNSSGSSGGSSGTPATSTTLPQAESTQASADSAAARASTRGADSSRVARGRAVATGTPAGGGSASVTQLELGATLFQKNCARCHGPDGRGDGPGVYTLDVKPQNFHDAEYMATRTDEDLLIS